VPSQAASQTLDPCSWTTDGKRPSPRSTHVPHNHQLVLADLGELVVADGIDAHSDHLFAVAHAAHAVAPAAAAVLVDTHDSEIARLRALAVASAAVLRSPAAVRLLRAALTDGTSTSARLLAA
jgi:hypothetical protein